MIYFLILVYGVLPGSTCQTIATVFPVLERIVGYEPGSNVITLYSLEGKRVNDYTLEGIPAYCCEAGGYIFVNYVDKHDKVHLLRTDSNFRWVHIVKNTSFFFPSELNGRTYGVDVIAYVKRARIFPPVAQYFDLQRMTFGAERLFKLPADLAKTPYPERFWLFPSGESVIALYATCSDILVLDKNYLLQEKVESAKIPGNPTRIPLDLPGGYKNKGSYTEKHALRVEDARKKREDWKMGQTIIFLAWNAKKNLMIGYGEAVAKQTHIARLDETYSPQLVNDYQGLIVGASGKRIWLLVRDAEHIEIKEEAIP